MSDDLTNGHDDTVSRILTLDAARKPGAKRSDLLTRQACMDLIAQALGEEVPKIHQFYLQQIPEFVRKTSAELIHGALLHYELIVEPDSVAAGMGMVNTAVPQSGDAESNPGEPPTHTPSLAPPEPAA